MTSAEAAKRLGPPIRNQTTTMGLYNLPKQCGCPKHPHLPNVPDKGTTHRPGEPCPFEEDSLPTGMLGTCCSLRGNEAAYELGAVGETDLTERMYEDMSCVEAETFAKELRKTADRLERKYASKSDKPKGAGWDVIWNAKNESWEYQNYSTFEEALRAIREAACWYEKVASLGYGVHAWY